MFGLKCPSDVDRNRIQAIPSEIEKKSILLNNNDCSIGPLLVPRKGVNMGSLCHSALKAL